MNREETLEQSLEKLITLTEQAREGGWIYTEEFSQVLDDARTMLPDRKETFSDLYAQTLQDFYVVQD